VDELKLTVQRALSYNEAVSENVYLRKQLKKKYQFSQIIGNSAKMQEVFKMIERVSVTDSTVLVLGESGTGKELVARALHFNSNRQFSPFIPINCSALPESLLESELFGHRRGSFTGALNDKKGLFQEADGGTIFLDEIGSMSQTLQSRLLRVLQEKEVRRVGDTIPTYVNVRVLAATHEPLEKKIKEGSFREDLYYRLNVISINLPGLRERADDIPLIAVHFLKDKIHAATGKPMLITKRAMDVLCNYSWPGNVRELENALERASVLCDEAIIKVADLPPAVRDSAPKTKPPTDESGLFAAPSEAVLTSAILAKTNNIAAPAIPSHIAMPSLKMFLREQELTHVNRVLAYTEGDKDRAAEILGISPTTLYRKLSEEDSF
jgi:transcriptional regulator with PAS, ATPase and Fis domain